MSESTVKASEVTAEDVMNAYREHHRRGAPDKAWQLKDRFDKGEPIPYDLLDMEGIKAEKPVEGKLEMPPRSGRGSGQERWAEFAEKVSDIGPEVLEKMSRDEIIEILEQREIIPTEEEDGDNGNDQEEDEEGDE